MGRNRNASKAGKMEISNSTIADRHITIHITAGCLLSSLPISWTAAAATLLCRIERADGEAPPPAAAPPAAPPGGPRGLLLLLPPRPARAGLRPAAVRRLRLRRRRRGGVEGRRPRRGLPRPALPRQPRRLAAAQACRRAIRAPGLAHRPPLPAAIPHACRALYIANKLNSSSTYPLLELFFKNQEKFSNSATSSLSGPAVAVEMSKMAAQAVGNSASEFLSGFSDSRTDSAARVSFKYGCTRGVYGAPFFFVNGFLQPGGGSPIDYNSWVGILDPLVSQNSERIEMFTSM